MTELLSSKAKIIAACERACSLAPPGFPPDLPTTPVLAGAPAWYRFEHEAWAIGEQVRQSLQRLVKLKRDADIMHAILGVVRCRNLRRGRQSFAMLLGYKAAAELAGELAPFLSDRDIDGHVLDALLKMRAPGFYCDVLPLLAAAQLWVRKLAQRYTERYAPAG